MEYLVTIVCSGNTCRSPMAEGILRKALAEREVTGIKVISAGTLGIVGAPATAMAVEVARAHDVDISRHLSEDFVSKIARGSDLILAMAREHYDAALELGAPEENVYMLKTFPRRTKDFHSTSVPDPIGGDRQIYERAFLQIDDALQQSVGEIIRRAVAKKSSSD